MKTKRAPWDYNRIQARLPIHDIQLEYFMLVNRLERDYGIDRVANIIKSWGKIEIPEKLEKAKILAIDLDLKCGREAERHDQDNDPRHYKTNGVE